MASQLEERYDERIAGVLSCYDRVVVTGALRSVCYAEGTRFLFANAIRIFDSPEFASKLRDRVRQRAASLAAEAGIEIEQIAKNHIRKEIVVARVLKARLSGLARQDATHKNFVRPDSGKCLHYYFYRHRSRSGLSARAHLGAVPPAILLKRPQLAGATTDGRGHRFHHGRQRLRAHRRFFARAGTRDGFSPDRLHAVLDRYAVMCCPVLDVFGQTYHWSLMPVEYSTDLTFRSRPRSAHSTSNSSGSRCSASKPSRSLLSLAARSLRNWLRNWAVSSRPGSKGPASSIASASASIKM
jgi:hypothetical protein